MSPFWLPARAATLKRRVWIDEAQRTTGPSANHPVTTPPRAWPRPHGGHSAPPRPERSGGAHSFLMSDYVYRNVSVRHFTCDVVGHNASFCERAVVAALTIDRVCRPSSRRPTAAANSAPRCDPQGLGSPPCERESVVASGSPARPASRSGSAVQPGDAERHLAYAGGPAPITGPVRLHRDGHVRARPCPEAA